MTDYNKEIGLQAQAEETHIKYVANGPDDIDPEEVEIPCGVPTDELDNEIPY